MELLQGLLHLRAPLPEIKGRAQTLELTTPAPKVGI